MVDRLHIHIRNTMMKPLAIALSKADRRVTGEGRRW
jgi:hypothetical protein